MKRALLAGCAAIVVLAVTGPARAADQAAIDKAIERGVTYLRTAPLLGGNEATQPNGVAALMGLTLLECGAAPDDKAVQHALEVVRPAAVTMDETYSLALAILFLDRLGDPADEPLIQSMTVRLLAGQNAVGGWTYNCPDIPESEVRRLTGLLQQQTTLIGRREPPKDGDKDAPPPKRTSKDLPKEIQAQIALIKVSQEAQAATAGGFGDNSNTQFATVALWVARRHGLPVDDAVARIDRRYRSTQNSDGGWAYQPGFGSSIIMNGHSSGTMTCAGLLGLAVAQGARTAIADDQGKSGPDLEKDKALKTALEALGTIVGAPVDRTNFGSAMPQAGGRTFYFLWSLERVAVALDLDTIGGKDWYAWGSDFVVASQQQDGSWSGDYAGQIDTCFALLFLRRANLTRDLSAHLKGKMKDPGEVTLRSGGVGGEALSRVGDVQPHDGPPATDKPPKNPVESWPPAAEGPEGTEGGRMARELAQAPANRRDELLQQYRDGKGVTYTEALAGAIPQLSGDGKKQARDALAERLTRMKADTLSRYFQDQDAEIRRAAVLAAAMKEAKTLIPDLIPLLSDREPTVAHAAHAALKDLSGESLGPTEDEWKAWWKNRDR